LVLQQGTPSTYARARGKERKELSISKKEGLLEGLREGLIWDRRRFVSEGNSTAEKTGQQFLEKGGQLLILHKSRKTKTYFKPEDGKQNRLWR